MKNMATGQSPTALAAASSGEPAASEGAIASSSSQSRTLLTERMNSKDEWIKLNVGGTVFLTTKTTLCREKGSFLARLCQDDPDLPSLKVLSKLRSTHSTSASLDEDGAYLIDRDPRYFPPILNYLRHNKLIIDSNLSEEGVLEEAEFYNLPSIVALINEKMNASSKKKLTGDEHKHVYRVLHCQEGELTQMLSTLSDGWKMTQLVNIGSQYSYSSEDQSEFLVVVSRDFDETPRKVSKPTNKERVMTEHGLRM